MLMIDKSSEIRTLRNLGATDSLIKRIFTFEGWLVCGSGAIGGTLFGILLCMIQQHFEVIKLGAAVTAQYVVPAYPVQLIWSDVFLTFISVTIISWIATTYTTHSQKL